MLKCLVLFIFAFLMLPINIGRAEDVQELIRQECKREVLKKAPLKITYNWGKLIFTHAWEVDKLPKDCLHSGLYSCFLGKGDWKSQFHTESVQIKEYRCFYPVGNISFNFSDSQIYIRDHPFYYLCESRLLFRHGLQHFMIWKAGYKKMLAEVQRTLLDRTLKICKDCQETDHAIDLDAAIRSIFEKWQSLIDKSNQKFDADDPITSESSEGFHAGDSALCTYPDGTSSSMNLH